MAQAFLIEKSRSYLTDAWISISISLISYFFLQYNIEGDQAHYNLFYEFAKKSSFFEALSSSYSYIGSLEPIYPVLVWVLSSMIAKDIFMAIMNGLFAYFTLKLAGNILLPRFLIIIFLFTNYYAYVIYTSAERLKISLIFSLIAVIFFLKKDKTKLAIIFGAISILTHIQTLFIFSSLILSANWREFTRNMKFSKLQFLIGILAVIFSILFYLKEHIFLKAEAYISSGTNLEGVVKIILLFFVAYYSTDNKKLVLSLYLILFGAVLLVGSDRLVIFAYFYTLLLYPKGGSIFIRMPHYLLLIYFSFKSIGYLSNLIEYGDGFAG